MLARRCSSLLNAAAPCQLLPRAVLAAPRRSQQPAGAPPATLPMSQHHGGCGLTAPAAAPHSDAAGSSQQPQQDGSSKKLVLVVAVALVDAQQRVLLARRPAGRQMAGLWEFPGGKVDPGETPEAALVRELQEELSIQVAPGDLQPLTFASHSYESFHLLMPLYVCRRWSGVPRGAEGQALSWVAAGELAAHDMPAADVPLIEPVQAAMAAAAAGA